MLSFDDLEYVHFFVPGDAQTSGSKRAFVNKKTGRAMIVPASKKQKPWQDAVRWAAMEAFARRNPFEGPIGLDMVFVRARPKGHYGTGRNEGVLKDWAEDRYPTTKPDLLKLGRAVEDAMTKIIYIDDSQIVEESIKKVYGVKPGVDIIVRKLKPQQRKDSIDARV